MIWIAIIVGIILGGLVTWRATSAAHPASHPMSGSNARALKAWVAEHMPELDAELGPMGLDRVRVRLNEVTGCAVLGSDPVERTCAVFLAALQAQHAAGRAED